MTLAAAEVASPRKFHPRRRRGRTRSTGLFLVSLLVALILLMPLAFLLVEAQGAGVHTVASLIDRPLTLTLLWNTVRLAVVVTALCAVLGTGTAWLVERTDLPGRRVWAVLLVVPLAIPDFVVSFSWSSLSTAVAGYWGAVLVMTLSIYPLVYLPVAASLRNADPAQGEVAHGLGAGRLLTFWRVTLGQARVAILGGCLLVVLVLLAEYGAFEILGYQTFTTEIFTEFSQAFNIAAASALSLVLVALGLVVLAGESLARGRGRVNRVDRMAQHRTDRLRLGRWTGIVLLALLALVLLALGLPVGSAIYWWVAGPQHVLDGVSILNAAGSTALYGACAGAVATLMALPVGILAIRYDGRLRRMLERSTYLVLAMPGLVIALALAYFSEQYGGGLWYHTAPMLVLAYAIMFFPLALVGVRASVAQAPVGLENVAQSLGQGRLAVLWRVTRPLVGPGLAAAFCLVFLSVVTELTATLILVPTGVQTLATQFWNYQQNLAYGQAAPFALLMIAIAAVPSYVLGRFFDRLPARGGGVMSDREAAVELDGRQAVPTNEPSERAVAVAASKGVRVAGLFKSFSTQPVLRGVDLEVPVGSFTAILGPSGSGKTTLLRILAGFDRMDAGSVVIGGQVMEDGRRFVRPQRRGIGYVPQEGALFPHLTVADNVGFGVPRSERKGIAHLVELVGLTGLERRYPHQLSGGQQQRVALARALAIHPKVVLLDEPFSSLDASLRDGVRRDVARILAEANATTILVTHDQDEALGLADQIAVLNEGCIVATADPRSLYGDPSDLAAAVLIGDANIMAAEMHDGRARSVLGTVDVAPSEAGRGAGSVQLLLRPEQLVVHMVPENGRVKATVVEMQYHGHDALVRIALDAPGDAAFSARVPGDLALSRGQSVWVTVRGPGRVWTDR